MKRLDFFAFVIFIIIAGGACDKMQDGISVNPAGPTSSAEQQSADNSVSAQKNGGAIDFFFNGVNVGTYYIVGSYDGGDNVPHGGINSRKDSGIGGFSGLPYQLSLKQKNNNTFLVSVVLGPAQKTFATVSLPLDPGGKAFEKFSFSGAGYGVGCGNGWSQRSGSGGKFSDIPTPCYIPGAGYVGAARSFYRTDGEITSSSLGVKIKRTYVSGDCDDLLFYNHPGTNNVERGFGAYIRGSTPTLTEGQSLSCTEEISVLPNKK